MYYYSKRIKISPLNFNTTKHNRLYKLNLLNSNIRYYSPTRVLKNPCDEDDNKSVNSVDSKTSNIDGKIGKMKQELDSHQNDYQSHSYVIRGMCDGLNNLTRNKENHISGQNKETYEKDNEALKKESDTLNCELPRIEYRSRPFGTFLRSDLGLKKFFFALFKARAIKESSPDVYTMAQNKKLEDLEQKAPGAIQEVQALMNTMEHKQTFIAKLEKEKEKRSLLDDFANVACEMPTYIDPED